MRKEVVACDYCEKECSEDHVSIYLCSQNHVISKNEICMDCYNIMKDALKQEGGQNGQVGTKNHGSEDAGGGGGTSRD